MSATSATPATPATSAMAARTPARRPALRMASAVLAALALAASVSLVGCEGGDNSTSPARYNLDVEFMGMAPHVGQNLYLRVWHLDTGVEVARTWMLVVQPDFTVAVPDILILGEQYNVDFWADLNMDGTYNSFPTDHTWRRTLGPVAGSTTLTFMHDTNWVDIQWPPAP